jgi:hypothetical protein
VITAAEAVAGKTIFARFAPSVKALTISGPLKLVGTGLNQNWLFQRFFHNKTLTLYNLEFWN